MSGRASRAGPDGGSATSWPSHWTAGGCGSPDSDRGSCKSLLRVLSWWNNQFKALAITKLEFFRDVQEWTEPLAPQLVEE